MPPPIARRAPYKDFLQPALQKRFAITTCILLAISYVEALTWSTWNSIFWPWFPFGLAGLRTLAIFACVLPVVILRIAHSHIGIRTSNSPFETFCRNVFPFANLETVITYTLSAWLFSQAYLLSTRDEANLRWITQHSGDRARLNERALFYTMSLVSLGVVQGIMHVSLDHDRMILGTVKAKRDGESGRSTADSWEKLGQWAPVLIFRAGMLSISVGVVNYVFVYHFLRRTAWGWALSFFRLFYNLPKSNMPPSHAPWSIWMLGRSIWAGYLLCLLWCFGDMAFRLQLGKEPLKNDRPLTSESKDPNGSLLNGLKSKKDRISAFAMWELAFISRDFDVRRKAIFEDIDRKDGPMWSQVYVICLNTIKTIEQRIDDYGKPPAPPTSSEAVSAPPQPRERVVLPPRTDNVWASATAPQGFGDSLGRRITHVTTSPGKTPAESLVPAAKKKALEMRDQLLTKQQKEAVSPQAVNSVFRSIAHHVLTLPIIGSFFQELFGRRLSKAILGTPYAEVSVYINAAYTLSQLAVSSLTEDRYGNVQRDVPAIIRTFTTIIKKLERFRDEFPMHWTDLEQKRDCPEVERLLDALKDGLGELIAAFGPYSSDLRLSRADMRLAKEAARKKEWEEPKVVAEIQAAQPGQSEMQQVS